MIENKIKKSDELKSILLKLKEKRKKIVFTNGCFDLIHYGHVKYLEDAKKNGDVLVVAVNSDKSVKKIKGDKRPIVNQESRIRVIASLESVDYAVLFDEETPYELIKFLMPDILVKGGDWAKEKIAGSDVVTRNGGEVKTIPFIHGFSSTSLIDKIKKNG